MFNNLNCNSDKLPQPKSVLIPLKEHQKTAFTAMNKIEDNGCVVHKDLIIETTLGILADIPGSGKSMMIIALIANCVNAKFHKRVHYGSPFVCLKDTNQDHSIKTNLILVPNKLVLQWKNYFMFCPSMKVYSISTKKDLINLKSLNDYDVLICSDSKYKFLYEKYQSIKWSRLIIDEIDSIKLPSVISWNANFIWLITSYPDNLLFTNKNFMRMIFKNITNYIFNFLIVRNDTDFINLSLNLPKLNQNIIKCKTPKELTLVQNYVSQEVKDMLNANNINQAILKLNCNINTNKNIFQIITKNLSEELHNKNLEYDYYVNLIGNDNKIQEIITNIKLKIQQIKTKLDSIKKRIYLLNDDYCPICLDKYVNPTVNKCCNNVFCFKCIITTLNNQGCCPYCREPLNIGELTVIDNNQQKINQMKNENQVLSKNENLLKLLQNSPISKFMIFSNYLETFYNIQEYLDSHKIKYGILSGSEKIIKKNINLFEKGKINVLMSNLNNQGLDLHMVTDIIIYHKLKEDIEDNVISRGHRLGRTKPLNVHYLYYDNEYDDITI